MGAQQQGQMIACSVPHQVEHHQSRGGLAGFREQVLRLGLWTSPFSRDQSTSCVVLSFIPRIRVCEAENPSTVVSLRMGNFIFFMLHQILSEQQREGLCFPPREGAKDRSPSLFIAGRHRGPVCPHVVTLIPGPPMVPVITTLWTALFVLRYYMQRDSITCTSLSHRDRAPSEPVLGAQHPFVKWINERVDA